MKWVRKQRQEGREGKGEIEKRDIEVQKQERFESVKVKMEYIVQGGDSFEGAEILRVKGKEGRMIKVQIGK